MGDNRDTLMGERASSMTYEKASIPTCKRVCISNRINRLRIPHHLRPVKMALIELRDHPPDPGEAIAVLLQFIDVLIGQGILFGRGTIDQENIPVVGEFQDPCHVIRV